MQVVSVIAMLQIIARCAEAVGEECWVLGVLTHQFAAAESMPCITRQEEKDTSPAQLSLVSGVSSQVADYFAQLQTDGETPVYCGGLLYSKIHIFLILVKLMRRCYIWKK